MTADCVWQDRGDWLCRRGASLRLGLFHCLFCSMMGPQVGFCMPSLELLTCLNSRAFSKHLSSGLNVMQLQVSIQICDSLICTPCLLLGARSDLPVAIFCIENSVFFRIQLCEQQFMCYTCAGNTEYFSPES